MKELTKHTFLLPRADHYSFNDFTDDELRALSWRLTEKEKGDPDSAYYSLVPAPLAPAHQKALEAPMDPSFAFSFAEYGKYMNNTGYCREENGYCVLPDGVTYAAALIRQEGRNDEMTAYYNEHFGLTDSLFYKTWFPEAHYLHFNDGGTFEDFGFGRVKMRFTAQLDARMLGLDPDEIRRNDPACIYLGGTAAIGRNLDSKDPMKEERNIIMFYHRETPCGREMRIRLFYGIGYENGEFIYTLPEKERALDIARCTYNHIVHEYTNDLTLQNAVYRDYKNGKRQ